MTYKNISKIKTRINSNTDGGISAKLYNSIADIINFSIWDKVVTGIGHCIVGGNIVRVSVSDSVKRRLSYYNRTKI